MARPAPSAAVKVFDQGSRTGTPAAMKWVTSRLTTTRSSSAAVAVEEIGLAEGVPAPAARFHHEPPAQHRLLADRQHPVGEERAQGVLQPGRDRRPALGLGKLLDAATDLGEGHRRDEEHRLGLGGDEGDDVGITARLARFGKHVGVEEEASPSSTARTGPLTVGRSSSTSCRGELIS